MPLGTGQLGARLQVKIPLLFTNLDFLDEIYLQPNQNRFKVDRPHLHTLSQESRDIDQSVDLKRFSARIGKWNLKNNSQKMVVKILSRQVSAYVCSFLGVGGPGGG